MLSGRNGKVGFGAGRVGAGRVGVGRVISFSSEDLSYPACNLTSTYKSWKCSRRDAVAGRASVTVELEHGTFVEQIEITNAGSAFVQMDGVVSEGTSPVPLLPMKSILSEGNCSASSTDYTAKHSFSRSDFAPDSFRRFKQLVITVSQPFRLGVPFGFSGVRVTKPSYAGQIQKQTPALTDPSKKDFEFSFMKKTAPAPPKPLQERVRGLNDCVADEDFEMNSSTPMQKLGSTTTVSNKPATPSRNSYFASINETHDFVYKMKTPRSTKKRKDTPKSSEKEKENVDNTSSFCGDTTPSRKRKKSSPANLDKLNNKSSKYKSDETNEDIPDFYLSDSEDQPIPPRARNLSSPGRNASSPKNASSPSASVSSFMKSVRSTTVSLKGNKPKRSPAPKKAAKKKELVIKPLGTWINCSFGAGDEASPDKNGKIKEKSPSSKAGKTKASTTKKGKAPKATKFGIGSGIGGSEPTRENDNIITLLSDSDDDPIYDITDERKPSRSFSSKPPVMGGLKIRNTLRISGPSDDSDILVCDPLPSRSAESPREKVGSSATGKQDLDLTECPICSKMISSDIVGTHVNRCLDLSLA